MVFRGAYMPGYVVCSIPFFWSGTKPCLSTYSASFAIRENSSFCSCGSGSKWGAQSLAGLRLNMYWTCTEIHGAKTSKTWLIYSMFIWFHLYVLSPRSRALSLRLLGKTSFILEKKRTVEQFIGNMTIIDHPFFGIANLKEKMGVMCCISLDVPAYNRHRADDLHYFNYGSIRVARTGEKRTRHTETEPWNRKNGWWATKKKVMATNKGGHQHRRVD